MGLLKFILPLLFDYAKEILIPGEGKRTTLTERIAVLTMIMLFTLLMYVAEQFFLFKREHVRVNTYMIAEPGEVPPPPPTVLEPPVPYDAPPPTHRKPPVAREEDLRALERRKMIDHINGV